VQSLKIFFYLLAFIKKKDYILIIDGNIPNDENLLSPWHYFMRKRGFIYPGNGNVPKHNVSAHNLERKVRL